MKKIIIGLVSFLICLNVSAQTKKGTKSTTPDADSTSTSTSPRNQDKPYQTELIVNACFRGDSIVLRWSTKTPGAWRELNKAGVTLSRTILDESGSFDPATFRNLSAEPIKPWPLEKWATIAGQTSKDDMAKVAAQAVYGKSFVTSTGFIAKADEFATRFSFSMLAADMSINAAYALGVRYADKEIEKGKIYVYKIASLVDTSVYKISPDVIVMNTNDVQPVPVVSVGDVKEKQNLIELQWKRDLHDQYFSGYYIERSDDNGRTYKRRNTIPFIHAVDEKNHVTVDNIVYQDSIPTNYKSYWYRVVGITPFAELAPPSKPVKAIGRDRTPPVAPVNVKAQHIGGSQVKVTWEYPKQGNDIKGFLIGRGDNPAKRFEPLTTKPLSAKTREYIDEHAIEMGSNYYIVAVVDTAGNASVSLAKYAMIIDSLPPTPPKGLTGSIDSTGRVNLHWKLNQEKDIKGYLVFFSNSATHEFSQITKGPVADTVYQDSITLKTLTKKIYYRVVAIDYNSNYSKFSDILELKRPDIVPPSAAVFDSYKVSEKGIDLVWVPSESEDLEQTVLYRMENKTNKWTEITSFAVRDKRTSYSDTTGLMPGNIYSYSLVSIDEDGLKSKRSVPIKLKYVDFSKRMPVENLFTKVNTEEKNIYVNWNYPVKGEYRFIVYRAVNGSPFKSYKSVDGRTASFKDNDVKKGSTYEYSVGVVYKNGAKAPFGKIVKSVF